MAARLLGVLGDDLELHSRAVRKPLERLREVEPMRLLDPVEDVALLAAAEAVEDLLARVDRQRGGPLVVKHATTHPLAARATQVGALGDQRVHVDSVPDPVLRLLRVARHQKPCGTARSENTLIA